MGVRQAIQVAYHLASVLEYGEKISIVHRDIKPLNIILLAENAAFPKLIDFGLAKTLGENYENLTRTGMVMGSPFYMSREAIMDAKRCDHRTDLYSLGATLYHILAKVPPFHQFRKQGPERVLYYICKTDPIPLQEHVTGLPEDLYKIVHKLIQHSLEARYQSAKELRKDLRRLVQSEFA